MRKFGLIGYPLGHSFSKGYFTRKFSELSVTDAVYENFPLESIEELQLVLDFQPELRGLNVTIPYKEQVIHYLHHQSPEVKEINACNCIAIKDGKLTGYNTDFIGFKNSLLVKLKPHHTNALILGWGGASKAVAYALKTLGINYLVVSRRSTLPLSISYDQLNGEIMSQHQLIINCTPIGMHPSIEQAPSIPYQYITDKHFLFDLIYNPAQTLFLQLGEERGATIENGMDMLTLQAEESWRIWNS
jgi:shikimate dehydrogenase